MSTMDEGGRHRTAFEIVEELEDGLALHDSEFRFVWLNRAAEELLGVPEPGLLGRTLWEALPVAAGTPLEAGYRRAMEERQTVRLEYFFDIPGKWCEIRVSPHGDSLRAQFHDITERKLIEESVHARSMFPEQNPYPVLRVSRDGTCLYANPSSRRFLEEWGCAVGSRAPEQVRRAVEAAIAENALKELDITCRGRQISFVVAPLVEVDCANLYGRDVTVQKQAEEMLQQLNAELEQRVAAQTSEIRRSYEELQAERQRLRDILDLLPVYAVLLSPDYHVPLENRFFRERFGESRGRRCYEYLFQRTGPCENCESFIPFKTGRPHRWEWTGPDGRAYDIYDFPFKDIDGSKLVMEVGLDITDRKRAEAEVAKHRDKLAELVAERTAQLEAANQELHSEIAERRRAEGAVRESEEKYRALFEQMTEGFAVHEIICDEKGVPCDYRFIDINPAFGRLTGLKRDEVVGNTLREVLPNEDPVWIQKYGAVALTGVPVQFQHYAQELGRHYEVLAYRPAPGQFAVIFSDISERKQAEERLFESNQRLAALMNSLPVGVSFSDDATCLRISGNPALLKQFEITGADNISASAPDPSAAGRQVHFFRGGQELTDADLPLQRAVAENREIPPMELEVHLPNGRRWIAETSGAPVRDATGAVTGGVAVTLDITKRKQAEGALEQSRKDMARAEEVGQIGWWRLDTRQDVLTWSDENHRIFGVPKGAPLTYEVFLGIVHPDDRQYVNAQWTASLRGAPHDVEHRIVADGQVKWVREKAYLEFDEAGTLLGGFGITQDITERKRAEALIRERENELRLVMNMVPALISYIDSDFRHRRANQGYERWFGVKPQDLEGRHVGEVLGDLAWELVRSKMKRAMAGETVSYEEQLPSSTGEPRWVAVTLVPDRDTEGQVRGIGMLMTDITVHKQAEATLRQSEERMAWLYDEARQEIARRERVEQELRRSNADLAQFAFVISHDLRSPLNAITSFSTQLTEELRGKLGPDADTYLTYLTGAAARMRRLISDLLVYSRVAAYDSEEPSPRDSEGALRAAELNLQESIRKAGAVVTHDALPGVIAAPGLLTQVFQNLIENAIKFRGEAAPKIHVSAKQQEEEWRFCVEDNGIGIEPQHVEQVFRIFKRLHGDTYQGTGIGLAVCKKIVERQGGRIWVESMPGQGSRFYFTLPASMSKAAEE